MMPSWVPAFGRFVGTVLAICALAVVVAATIAIVRSLL